MVPKIVSVDTVHIVAGIFTQISLLHTLFASWTPTLLLQLLLRPGGVEVPLCAGGLVHPAPCAPEPSGALIADPYRLSATVRAGKLAVTPFGEPSVNRTMLFSASGWLTFLIH